MTQPTWLDALAQELRAAGYEAEVIPPDTNRDLPSYIDAGYLAIQDDGEMSMHSAIIIPEDWAVLDIIHRHLVAAGLAPAPVREPISLTTELSPEAARAIKAAAERAGKTVSRLVADTIREGAGDA